MKVFLNADEVFEMAIQIETNGAAFYRKAAGLQSDARNVEFLNGLAAMEDQHKKTFAELREKLTAGEMYQQAFDPEGEASLYLQAVADTHGGEGSPSVADSLTGRETMEEIIRIALDLENKSILYYVGLKEMVRPDEEKKKVDNILSEEHKHVAQLTKALKKA
ncbi:MAG: ferritin family protein [Deltaproteobacteria bacterium]|nr:ferritin family protein [Deltaproteobacteria bacterium]